MFISFILSLWARRDRYVWVPDLDLTDGKIVSALIPHAQY